MNQTYPSALYIPQLDYLTTTSCTRDIHLPHTSCVPTCTQAYPSPLEWTTSRGWLLWQRRCLLPAPRSGPGAAGRAEYQWGPKGCRTGQRGTQPAQCSGHRWEPQCWLCVSQMRERAPPTGRWTYRWGGQKAQCHGCLTCMWGPRRETTADQRGSIKQWRQQW